MDEIAMFAELKPEAPAANTGQLREAARARLTAEIAAERDRQPTGAPRLPGPRWRVAATVGAVAAVAATAAVVAVVLPGGGTPATGRSPQHSAAGPASIVTAAWVVQRESDGTVTLTFKEARATSPAVLQRALGAEGVRAVVVSIPEKSLVVDGVTVHYPGCSYPNLHTAPGGVQNAVLRQYWPGGSKQDAAQYGAWIISPSAMPPGSTLFVETGYEANPPQVLEPGRSPACVPASPAAVRHDFLRGRQLKEKAAKQK